MVWEGRQISTARRKNYLSEAEGVTILDVGGPMKEVGHNQEAKKEINALFGAADMLLILQNPNALFNAFFTLPPTPAILFSIPSSALAPRRQWRIRWSGGTLALRWVSTRSAIVFRVCGR